MALEHGLPGERGPALERAPARMRGPAREPMIIRARVQAWLLGIRLLTLEAHIAAGSDGGLVVTLPRYPQPEVLLELPATHVGAAGQERPATRSRPVRRRSLRRARRPGRVRAAARTLAAGPGSPAVTGGSAPSAAPGTSVAMARQLVEQGTRTLEQERKRPRGY
jgi:hypothetical protein